MGVVQTTNSLRCAKHFGLTLRSVDVTLYPRFSVAWSFHVGAFSSAQFSGHLSQHAQLHLTTTKTHSTGLSPSPNSRGHICAPPSCMGTLL